VCPGRSRCQTLNQYHYLSYRVAHHNQLSQCIGTRTVQPRWVSGSGSTDHRSRQVRTERTPSHFGNRCRRTSQSDTAIQPSPQTPAVRLRTSRHTLRVRLPRGQRHYQNGQDGTRQLRVEAGEVIDVVFPCDDDVHSRVEWDGCIEPPAGAALGACSTSRWL